MKENYLALLLSIVKEISADEALIKMGIVKRRTGAPEIWDGIKLEKLVYLYEKGISYKDIAKYFRTTINAINFKIVLLKKLKSLLSKGEINHGSSKQRKICRNVIKLS